MLIIYHFRILKIFRIFISKVENEEHNVYHFFRRKLHTNNQHSVHTSSILNTDCLPQMGTIKNTSSILNTDCLPQMGTIKNVQGMQQLDK